MIIRGNKKGGSGGGEDPNTLSTETVAKGLYLFSEGPVEGLSTDDGKSIYFNDVPLIDANDEVNFEGVTWTFRNGDPDQDWIPGFTSSVSTSAVGEQVTFSSPVVQTITGNYDAVNVIVSIPVLTYLNSSSGTLEGADLSYAIDVKTATGSYVTVYNVDLIKQKSTSEVQRIYRVDLPPGGSPWSVRLRRLTADSSDTNLQNDLYFGALATVVDGKFNYRNSCVLGIQLNAKQFQNSIPTVKAKIKGIKVWVPKNYDPITRTYATAGEGTSSGIWDGTFKAAWTNNPVWIYHDLLINNRYGLGEDFNPEDDPESAFVDKWSLYTIAQFCDEMVSDGYDGQEPRYSINTQITDKQEAYNLLQSIISSLNGMIYFSAEQIVAVADMPGEVDDVFTQADVIDGIFEYSGTALKTRHSVVLAYFNDPTNLYKKDQVVYEEYESITKLGYKPLEIEIFGCTSRAQAMRTAKWALHTEKSQTQTVTFKTGFRGGFLTPGNLIKIFDDYKAGERRGGRIISSSASGGSITFTLDQAVTLPSGSSIVYLNSNGEVQTKFLTGSYTNSSTVTAVATDLPVDGGVYGLISPDINGQLFRVLSVQENDVNEYTVIALEHDDTKYAIIDADQLFGDPQTSVYGNSRLSPVTNGSYQEWYEEISGSEVYPRVTLSWEKPNDARITGYELQLKTPTQDYYTVQDANILTWDSPRLQADFDTNYGARVRAKDGLGRVSSWYYFVDFNVIGKDQAPGPPTNVTVTGIPNGISINWDNPTNSDFKFVEVWAADSNVLSYAVKVASISDDFYIITDLYPGDKKYIWLRSVSYARTNQYSNYVGPYEGTARGISIADFDDNVTGIPIVDVLPDPLTWTGPNIVYLTTDGELYILRDGTWYPLITEIPDDFDPGIPGVTTLPDPTGLPEGKVVFNTTDGKLYRITGGVWVAVTADGIESGSTLPSSATEGAVFMLTTDGKLYRYHSGAWTAEVPSIDIVGTLTDSQLANLSTTKLVGQITSTQITDSAVTTAKINAGAITTNTIAAGAVIADRIATNAVTADKILAGAITTAKIATGAITANELAADSVTAGKIQANSISSDKLQTNSVTALKIVAGAIESDKLATNSVTAGKIAAGAVTANAIGAGTVTVAINLGSSGKIILDGVNNRILIDD